MSGTDDFAYQIQLYNADMHEGVDDYGCMQTLGIGCAPKATSPKIIVGQRWGMGSDPVLTRDCNPDELNLLSNEPWPY